MGLYMPHFGLDNGPDEYDLEIAKNEIARLWYSLNNYEKEGLKSLIEELGKKIELEHKQAEVSKLEKEINELEQTNNPLGNKPNTKSPLTKQPEQRNKYEDYGSYFYKFK